MNEKNCTESEYYVMNEKNCTESEYYVNICKLFLVSKQKIEKLEVQKKYIYINDYIYKVKIYTL